MDNSLASSSDTSQPAGNVHSEQGCSSADPLSESDTELSDELLRALEDSEREEEDVEPRKRRRVDVQPSAAPEGAAGAFTTLPDEVVVRVLSFLSAEDLSVLAQASSYFRTVTLDDEIWRRLFLARWGQGNADRRKQAETSWKALFREQDTADLEHMLSSAPGVLLEYYIQMTVAKRSESLDRKHRDDLLSFQRPKASVSILSAWRQQHGVNEAALPEKHCCSSAGRAAAFLQLDAATFVCEACGWGHVCDDVSCRERYIDPGTDLPVCPISGRCFNRMVAAWEEEGDARQKEEETHAEDLAEEGPGRLARAYLAGYNCATEEELAQVCGAVL